MMIDAAILKKAYSLMCAARCMADTYENNRQACKYVHSTSSGHEAIQLAVAFHLQPRDFVSPYYRDESLLLGLGFEPYQLMLQLLAKRDDGFSGGRSYYSHPSHRSAAFPTIIHQSSATGMQVIPTTGVAQGVQYMQNLYQASRQGKSAPAREPKIPVWRGDEVVVCSFGDASITEGEVSEAFQFAILKKLPIIYLVQDNGWGISATSQECRAMDAFDYAAGFPGLSRLRVDGSDFEASYLAMARMFGEVRGGNGPCLVQATVPLLGHHTSGVRREFYRSKEELQGQQVNDPRPRLRSLLLQSGVSEDYLKVIEHTEALAVASAFQKALQAPDPVPASVAEHVLAPTPVTEETGERSPANAAEILLVDAALFAIREIMETYPEALLYGQDVGRRLGGVFREAATLAARFGDHRVFNTAIQEAYIIGSTAGLSAVGAKPIVEVQFADYIYPGFNQLVTEISKSCYLTIGKFPVQTLIRVPVGAYGGGGPYHSGSIETTLLSIKGIKVVYPSNAADMKGLMKAAFLDPNPVVMLEHKGLYWSKVPGTEAAKCAEPSADYVIPLGKGRVALAADPQHISRGETCCVITYGMGIYWATAAAKQFAGQIEIIDLRTLYPLDEKLIFETVRVHGKCLVLTEEQQNNSFAEALSGRISKACFQWLDGPVEVMGAMNLPAVPMNILLENEMLPNAAKVAQRLSEILRY